ncbi:LemA family protein [Paraburkholderia phymatum]|uniref:LemA family protein n=1 Tax=Paraburkholderia phymatum (strain DSM 17167 / CIP 108236 / LMG 21445 / STM815) TaxID=391038 RepID=B2JH81_PARP8|nr:LemA family protein [Paraburkholderia phymatum]ACC70319.1 LemA family protein [Paraburkholderia phymatum STM815]
MMKALLIIPILFALHALAGCGIAPSLHADEQVKAAFSDVITRYDERLGLADEAIALARHYLPAQASTFKDIADARSAIEALHATPALVDERALFERFDVAQRQMTEAISQLLVVCESVRGLDTAPRLRTLQMRLASSAARIAAARARYDEAALQYNASLHRFPFDLAAALHADQDKPTFSTQDRSPVHRHPRTDFGTLRGSLRV